MYAGTTFKLNDQSYIDQTTEITELDQKTLFFVMTTADKGTEKLTRISGDNFYKMFGKTLSFNKHGQSLLQAKKIIDAGGELLIKRFVADDATISNAIIVAHVNNNVVQKRSDNVVQKVNSDGAPLYIDRITGEETTIANGNEGGVQFENAIAIDMEKSYSPLYIDASNGEETTSSTTMINGVETANEKLIDNDASGAIVKFEVVNVEGKKSYDEVAAYAETLFIETEDTFSYPLIIATDIGRNVDVKRLAFRPDYDTSKTLNFMMYHFVDFEGAGVVEAKPVTMNPDIIYKDTSYAINTHSMEQFTLGTIPGVFEAYVTKLSEISGINYEELINNDLLFCKNRKGVNLPKISVDEEGSNIGYEYGIELKGGSDGTEFGTAPKNSEALANKMKLFLQGSDTAEIYDVDIHKIAIIPDANYPIVVKEAIAEFVNFRKDCFYLRDLGLGLTSFNEIMNVADKLTKTRYASDYMTTYQVYDPYTNKRIDVTMIYGMIEPLVNHFQSGAARPIAGEVNGFVITDAIPGTVNYIPRNTPYANQKDELDDARINYATYYDYGGNLIVDSLYTSQNEYTQLSYANNMIAIQEIMRIVRNQCPKNRFSFITGDDFSDYKKAVNNVLRQHSTMFNTLEMVYEEDPIKASQKIFYAVIKFSFNNWVQSESFDLYAINAETEE